jgi:hypothetical protein
VKPAVPVRVLACAIAVIVGAAACTTPPPTPATTGPLASTSPIAASTPAAAFGLTWGLVQDVALPEAAFAIPTDLPTAPTGPGTAGHPGHFGGQSIVHDVAVGGERLLAVGYTAVEGIWTADAWTSTTGTSWTLATIDDRPGSLATAVADRAGATFVAVGHSGMDPAAWTSPDGATWTRASVGRLATGARAGEPERITTVIATPAGMLAGGSAGPELGDRRARFWRSTDGATWSPIADAAAFEGAEVVAITPVPTGYLAVGRLGTGQRATGSIAWLSADATTWRRIDDPALAGGLVAAVAVTPNGVLAVGSDLDEREAAVWTSVDGETWTKAAQEASRLHFGEKVRMTDLVATESGYVGVGNFVGVQYGTGTSWLSKDGLTWLAAPLQAALGQGEPEAVIAWRDRLISVGSRGAPDNYIPSVWISPNVP